MFDQTLSLLISAAAFLDRNGWQSVRACFAGQVGRYLGDQVDSADLELDGVSVEGFGCSDGRHVSYIIQRWCLDARLDSGGHQILKRGYCRRDN